MAEYVEVPAPETIDYDAVRAALRGQIAPDVGVFQRADGAVKLKKGSAWTDGEIVLAGAIVATTPTRTKLRDEVKRYEGLGLELQAALGVAFDEINLLRVAAGRPPLSQDDIRTRVMDRIRALVGA